MRSLRMALPFIGALIIGPLALTPSPAAAQAVDVTQAGCAAVASDLAANPEKWPAVHQHVLWSHGYTISTESRKPGFSYEAVEAFMKTMSAGKCPSPQGSLFAAVKPLIEHPVSEDDAWDLTEVNCGEWFKENTEESDGRLDDVTMLSDLAWLDGYIAARRQAPPQADFAALATASRTVFEKCKANPRLNVSTLFELAIAGAAPAPARTP